MTQFDELDPVYLCSICQKSLRYSCENKQVVEVSTSDKNIIVEDKHMCNNNTTTTNTKPAKWPNSTHLTSEMEAAVAIEDMNRIIAVRKEDPDAWKKLMRYNIGLGESRRRKKIDEHTKKFGCPIYTSERKFFQLYKTVLEGNSNSKQPDKNVTSKDRAIR